MRVETIVTRVLGRWAGGIHSRRLTAMLVVVGGIVRAGRLSVTRVGRALASRAMVKHSIKRVDRLLSNAAFHRERWSFFAAISEYLIGSACRPVIVVDWTKVVGQFHALYAAVPVGGRAQTVYLEVHPERRLEARTVHERFLRGLKAVLPKNCRPIVVSDAGFHGHFFREVQRLGWDFVGRLRGRTTMRPLPGKGGWTNVHELYGRASNEATDLGSYHLYKKVRGLEVRLVLIGRKKSRRHPWRRKLSTDHVRTMTACKEPWLLATSLTAESACDVARLYGTRMQIEETFRDAKNHRFGWSLRDVRCASRARLETLLVLCTLATLAVSLAGLAVERASLHRRFQANTVKTRVLSHFFLGAAYFSAFVRPPVHIRLSALRPALHPLPLQC